MPTNFNTSIDTFTDPTDAVTMDPTGLDHASQHANANDAIHAIESVIGTASAPILASLNSPAFVGTPTAPTPSTSDNSTRIATTAFVVAAIAAGGGGSDVDTSYAPLASPVFSGTPTAPTATTSDSTLKIATTAFVHNVVAALGGGGFSAVLGVYDMTNPTYATGGAVGVGSSSADQTAYTNALTAMVANGSGILLLPAAPITLSNLNPASMVGPNSGSFSGTLPYAVRGHGSKVSIIHYTGSTLASSLTVTAAAAFCTGSPYWGGFSIDGSGASGTAVGLSWSDVSQVLFQDISIGGFSASAGIGMYFYNQVGWCERVTMDGVQLYNNTVNMDFAVKSTGYPSFAYWAVHALFLDLNANQDGIVDEIGLGTSGGAGQVQHIGVFWRMIVNANNGATNTGALFRMKGFSKWINVEWNINGEIDGGAATNHTSFVVSNASTSINGNGIIYLLGSWQSPSLNYATQLAYLTGNITIPGVLSQSAFNITPSGISRGVNANPATITLTSGGVYQNTTGQDLWLLIPITSTGVATAKLTKQFYNITSAPTNTVFAAAASGYTSSLSILVQNQNYLRIDLVNATFGTVTAEPV